MKHITQSLTIILLSLFLCSGSFGANKEIKKQEKRILVSLDFSEVLAQTLTQDTQIEVIRAIPENYAPDVHTNYLKKHWAEFALLAQNSDAILTASGAWPQDPLYPWGRRANIRIVPIDFSTPLDGSRAGIPLLDTAKNEGGHMGHIWNSPGNCARMADITATDLAQLFPEEAKTINNNLDRLKQELFKLRTEFELTFGQLEAFEVIGLTTDFNYLTDEFGVTVVKSVLLPEHKWTEKDIALLADEITSYEVRCVIAKWQPRKDIANAITASGAHIVVPKRFQKRTGALPAKQLIEFYRNNLTLLFQGLSSV